MAKDNKPKYFDTMLKTAPAFGLKAVLGDLPKGSIEHATEAKLRGSKTKLKDLLVSGLKGRGSGRAIGGAVGVASAPLFLKGLDYVTSKDKSKQRTGLALLGSSAAAYQGQKGFIEGYKSARSGGLGKSLSAKRGAIIGGTRIAYKTPSAILLGLSIASGRKKSKKGGGALAKYLTPALSGAAIGALSRGAESVALQKGMSGGKLTTQVFKKALPAAGGGAAGGVLGGLVLSAAVDGAMKALKKEGSATAAAGLGGAALLGKSIVDMLAHGLPMVGVGHIATKAAMGYGKMGRGLSKVPGGSKVLGATNTIKTKQLAMGIREGLAGRRGVGTRAGLGLGMLAPELKYNRQMGIEIGKLLRGVPPAYRETALLTAKRYITPTMRWSKRGEPVPVWNQLPDAIDMAVGKKKIFKRTGMSGLYNQLMHGGRGALSQGGKAVQGLPKALQADAKKKGLGVDLALLGGGVGLGAAATATGGLAALPLAALGSHGLIGGIKGLAVRSKTVQKKGLQSAAQGIREAFLPGMKKTMRQRLGEHAMDVFVSPASRDFGRMTGGAARRLAEAGRGAVRGGAQKRINQMVSPARLTFSQAAAAPMLGAGALAGLSKMGRE